KKTKNRKDGGRVGYDTRTFLHRERVSASTRANRIYQVRRLMRKWMSIVAIALGTALGGVSSSLAQTPPQTPPQPPPPAPAQPRAQASEQAPPGFLNVSIGGQVTKTHFTNSSTFSDFGETGTVESNQNVGQGFVFDVRGGRLIWGKFGIGAGLSVSRQNGASASTASIPDSLIVGQFTTVNSTAT